MKGLEGYSQREIMTAFAEAMDETQVKSQLESKDKGNLKNKINIEQFKQSLDLMNNDEYTRIDELVKDANINQIHDLYKSKELTCEKLVTYYLKRIEKYDINKLNSIIELNPEVIEVAKQKDKDGIQGKLYGIPVVLKANIESKECMATSAGAYALKDNVTQKDAFLVSKLREEGAIILGKANLSEFANHKSHFSPNGHSVLGGQTKNPYGLFDVGGSSSGSAASVAANLAMVAIGTETSGSMISPTNQNSVVGIKPSHSLVSRDGIVPIAEDMDVAGVMARNVEDLAIVLSVISKYDENDEKTNEIKDKNVDYTKYTTQTSLEGIKIGILELAIARFEEDEALERVATELQNLGAQTTNISIDRENTQGIDVSAFLNAVFEYDMNKYLQRTNIEGIKTLKDIVEFNNADLENTCPNGQKTLEACVQNNLSKEEAYEIFENNKKIAKKVLDDALKDFDAIVTISLGASSLYPAAGYPALNVPCGYKTTGQPMGATFVAGNLEDDKLISIAKAYELSTKHRKNPVLK